MNKIKALEVIANNESTIGRFPMFMKLAMRQRVERAEGSIKKIETEITREQVERALTRVNEYLSSRVNGDAIYKMEPSKSGTMVRVLEASSGELLRLMSASEILEVDRDINGITGPTQKGIALRMKV